MHILDRVLLHLSLIEGVGAGTVSLLIDRCAAQAVPLDALYDFNAHELHTTLGMSLQRADAIVHGLADSTVLEKEIALSEKHNVEILTINDESYPTYLKQIHLPPPVLYWKGAPLNTDELCMAVIGARRCTYYGVSAIKKFVPPLVESGWTIVSGGAIGADSAAHERALDAGGRTVAILGSGLLKPYPLSNKKLFERMIDNAGTLVSPFPLMMEAMPGNFPARNRIISGLSRGCLVVQAAERSGTHITAQYALEQGRELFAIPGPIDDLLSAGCHTLIQQGAKLVHTAQDIFDELEISSAHIAGSSKVVSNEECVEVPNVELDDSAAMIVHSCAKPCSLEELMTMTNMPMQDLYTHIFMLEVEGRIKRHGNGTWERC